MSEELKKLQEQMGETWTKFKATLEAQDKEIKAGGTVSAETKAKVDKLETVITEIQSKIDKVQTVLARPTHQEEDAKKKGEGAERKAAFEEWARFGTVGEKQRSLLVPAGRMSQKVMTVGDPTTGGYLAPAEYVQEIIKGIVEFSPLRSIARVRPTSAGSIKIPKRTGAASAAWVAETGTRAETTNPKYGLEEIPVHEMYALADISVQDLEDSAFNMEAELAAEFGEQFGVTEGTAFVKGTAVGQPEGFLTNAAVGITNSGDANLLLADGLISLFYALKDAYSRGATWVIRRSAIGSIRKLKGSDNNYLWQPGLSGSQPATILGQPYVEAPDMDVVAANNKPVALGDFRRGYIIVDRVQIDVLRDPYTQAATGCVRFIARKRVGGQVVLAEAIGVQKVAA